MKKRMQILVNGIFKENPVLVLVLGCCSVLAISVVRELLGSGSLLGYQIIPEEYTIRIISQTPGGFFMFGLAMAMLVLGMSKKGKKFVPEMGCGDGGCAGCGNAEGCTEKDKEAKN